jgi:hypothetical protein
VWDRVVLIMSVEFCLFVCLYCVLGFFLSVSPV